MVVKITSCWNTKQRTVQLTMKDQLHLPPQIALGLFAFRVKSSRNTVCHQCSLPPLGIPQQSPEECVQPRSLRTRRFLYPRTDLRLMSPTPSAGDCRQPSSTSGMSRGSHQPLCGLWHGQRIALGFPSPSHTVLLDIPCTLPLNLRNVSYRPIKQFKHVQRTVRFDKTKSEVTP